MSSARISKFERECKWRDTEVLLRDNLKQTHRTIYFQTFKFDVYIKSIVFVLHFEHATASEWNWRIQSVMNQLSFSFFVNCNRAATVVRQVQRHDVQRNNWYTNSGFHSVNCWPLHFRQDSRAVQASEKTAVRCAGGDWWHVTCTCSFRAVSGY